MEQQTPICPKCSGRMTIKKAKASNYKFWGCLGWPACDGKAKYMPVVEEIVREEINFNVKLNTYQQDFQDAVVFTEDNLILEAKPGTGKTFTALLTTHLLPKTLKTIFLSFDKETKKRNQRKAPAHIEVSTINASGRACIVNTLGSQFAGRAFVKDTKVSSWAKKLMEQNYEKGTDDYKKFKDSLDSICKIVELMRNLLTSPSADNHEIVELIKKNGTTFSIEEELAVKAIKIVWSKVLKDRDTYDFTDQNMWVVLGYVQPIKYDLILVDERQDLAELQYEYLRLMMHDKTRIVLVGDTFQCIYGFRGVSSKGIDDLKRIFKARVLPLDMTYRCPKSHVRLCNETFPEIPFQAYPDAIEGGVYYINRNQFTDMAYDGDMVLCRNNAPLVAPAFAIIRAGRKAIIKGRDIGEGLVSLIDKMVTRLKVESAGDLIEALEDYREKECEKIRRVNPKANALDFLNDKVDCIINIADNCDTVTDVVDAIRKIFSDNNGSGIVFSSIHKAKGDEASRVFILCPELMPSSKAQDDEAKQQERNIMWVAYTRSKKELYFVQTAQTN